VMHLKVLVSIVLNRRLVMLVSAFVSRISQVTGLAQAVCLLILLLKLTCLFLQIISADSQTSWLLWSFAALPPGFCCGVSANISENYDLVNAFIA